MIEQEVESQKINELSKSSFLNKDPWPEDGLSEVLNRDVLEKELDGLPPKHRTVVESSFGIYGFPLESGQIARQFVPPLSEQEVLNIRREALGIKPALTFLESLANEFEKPVAHLPTPGDLVTLSSKPLSLLDQLKKLLPQEEVVNGDYSNGDTNLFWSIIDSFPLLNAEQEVILAQKIEAGREAEERLKTLNGQATLEDVENLNDEIEMGQWSRGRLALSNLRLVARIARKYTNLGLSLEDLISNGIGGLMTAVDRFEWQQGNKFSTYATWWIRQAVTRNLADQCRTVRIPVHAHELRNRIAVAINNLESSGTEVNSTTIAEEVNSTIEKKLEAGQLKKVPSGYPYTMEGIEKFRNIVSRTEVLSLDEELNGFEDPVTRLDKHSDPNTLHQDEREAEQSDLKKIVEKHMYTSGLTPLERSYLKMEFGITYSDEEIKRLDTQEAQRAGDINMELEAVGQEGLAPKDIKRILGISRERVRLIKAQAVEKIKKNRDLKKEASEYLV